MGADATRQWAAGGGATGSVFPTEPKRRIRQTLPSQTCNLQFHMHTA